MGELVSAILCLLGICAVVIGPLILMKQGEVQRAREIAEADKRASQHFEALFARFATEAGGANARTALIDFLREHTVLTPRAGFFGHYATLFTRMSYDPTTKPVLEWVFEKTSFASADRSPLLGWLAELIGPAGRAQETFSLFTRLILRLKPQLSPAEATWLYEISLHNVEASKGLPGAKALALHLGRASYSAARPDRVPTIYDEQAINNDIGARCPPNSSA